MESIRAYESSRHAVSRELDRVCVLSAHGRGSQDINDVSTTTCASIVAAHDVVL